MMHVINWDKTGLRKLEKLTAQDFDKKRFKAVNKIIEDVRKFGDRALIKYTKRFDGVELNRKRLRVGEGDINKAYEQIEVRFIQLLKHAIENVKNFYRKRPKKSFRFKARDGVILEENYTPIERIGIYIPGGTAPLVSTVYMSVLPAKMAGVKEIAIASPPTRNGEIDPHILVVASMLRVKEIYRVGGPQAIAALAFGTKTIPKVDKIVGPGNVYVTEAKRQVYGFCDIDMIAGPSEVVVLADRHADPSYVASDLLAQAEHSNSTAILVTSSRRLANEIKKKVDTGYIIIVRSLKEAVKVINSIAPEHLQIMVKKPSQIKKKIVNAGAIFIGSFTPVAVGDYIAGPSHVLPTGGTARFYSALGIEDFIKRSHSISYTREALEKVKDQIIKLAEIEGLEQHKDSVEVRFSQSEKTAADDCEKTVSAAKLTADARDIKDTKETKDGKEDAPKESPKENPKENPDKPEDQRS